MEPAALDVELNVISVLDQSQWSAHGGLWRDVQDDRSVGRPAHPRIADPYHISYASLQQLRRQRHVTDFGHPRIPFRAAILQDHDTGLIYLQIRIVDSC